LRPRAWITCWGRVDPALWLCSGGTGLLARKPRSLFRWRPELLCGERVRQIVRGGALEELEEWREHGYPVVEETARRSVKHLVKIGGEKL